MNACPNDTVSEIRSKLHSLVLIKRNAISAIAESVKIRTNKPTKCEGFSFAHEPAILEATCSRDVFAHIFLKRTLPCVLEAGKAPISCRWLLPSSSTTSLLMGSCQDLNTQGNELGSLLLPNRTLRGKFTRIASIVESRHRFPVYT